MKLIPEVIQKKVTQKYLSLSKEEEKEINKTTLKLLKKYALSLIDDLEQKFPWYLRSDYHYLILILTFLSSATIGFLIGYFLESEQEINY